MRDPPLLIEPRDTLPTAAKRGSRMVRVGYCLCQLQKNGSVARRTYDYEVRARPDADVVRTQSDVCSPLSDCDCSSPRALSLFAYHGHRRSQASS